MNDVDATTICLALIASAAPLAALWLRLSFQLRRQRQQDRHTVGVLRALGRSAPRRSHRAAGTPAGIPRREHANG